MRLDDDAATTIEDTLDQSSAATANRLLREALDRRFDDLIEFEDGSLDGCGSDFRVLMAKKMRRNPTEPWHA